MAHHARIRAPGLWLTGTALDPSELEAFDLSQFRSIDGDVGGSWAPSSGIVIGGSGLSVTTTLLTSGTFEVAAGTFQMDVGSLAAIDADEWNFTGAIVAFDNTSTSFGATCDPQVLSGCAWTWQSGSTLTCAAGSTVALSGTISIAGVATFASTSDPIVQSGCAWTWQSGSTLTCSSGSTVSISGTCALAGATTLSNTLTKSGNDARVIERFTTLTANADNNVGITQDVWSYSQSTTTTRTITCLQTTGTAPTNGECIDLRIQMSTATSTVLNIRNETGATLICELTCAAGLGWAFITLIYLAGSWVVRRIAVLNDVTVTGVGAAFF